MDKTNRRIIKELLRDSRQSYRKIAERTGVTTSTVIKRMADMSRNGVIKANTVMLDPEKMGYELTAVIDVIFKQGKLLETQKKIAKMSNVVAVYDVTGATDSVIVAKFRNRAELSKFVKKLLDSSAIERTITHMVLNIVKEDFRINV